MSLERFLHAQSDLESGYHAALAELRAGRKRSHWIWYIFPQIEGLGSSSTALEFAIHDLDEACAYLSDPLLRLRYEESARVVAEHLDHGQRIQDLMGSRIDALKLVSSITLFRAAARHLLTNDPTLTSLVAHCD